MAENSGHICSVCNKTFGSAYNLQRHMVVHTKEKPFKCDYCESSYTQSSKLKNHIIKLHSDRILGPLHLGHTSQYFQDKK